MKPIFECQNLNHRNEMVTGVCFRDRGPNLWVCSRCIVEKHLGSKLEFLSFQQIIHKLADDANNLKTFLDQQTKKLVWFITKFENLRKKLEQQQQDYQKSIDLIKSEQFGDPLVRKMINNLKKKQIPQTCIKTLSPISQHLVNQDETWRRIKRTFEELGNSQSNKGTDLLAKGNSKQAMDYFELINELDTNSLVNLGKCLMAQKKYQRALQCFEKAMLIDKNNFVTFVKGIILKKQKQYDQALINLEEGKKKLQLPYETPYEKEIENQIGIILLKQNKILEAFTHLDGIIQSNPNYEEPYFIKIKYLIKNRFLDQAMACCISLLRNVTNSKRGYFYQGWILLAQTKEKLAQESFQQVIQLQHNQYSQITDDFEKLLKEKTTNMNKIFQKNDFRSQRVK